MKNRSYAYQSFDKFVQNLKQVCGEKRSGMMYIITDSGHAAHLILNNGNIYEITFGVAKGKMALELLKKIKRCRFHFSDNQKKSHHVSSCSIDTHEILHRLTAKYHLQESRYKILIVDDSQLVRRLVVNTLSYAYDVAEASNGLEAIVSLTRNKPDLILLDIIMPEMNGYETLNVIKKNKAYSDIPIFMLTSRDSLMDKLKGKMSSSDEYMTKPFTQEVLLKKIRSHLPVVRQGASADY